jgi:hypothetical protein
MAYGVILKHVEVEKITGGSFSKRKKSGRWRPFRQERGAGCPFFNWCGEHWAQSVSNSRFWSNDGDVSWLNVTSFVLGEVYLEAICTYFDGTKSERR